MAWTTAARTRCWKARWWASSTTLLAVAGLLVAATPTAARSGAAAPVPHASTPVTVVIDPGHNRYANLGLEPIGPGSHTLKVKDGGGTSGVVTHQSEASVNLRIGLRLRTLLLAAGGVRVVMTRTTTCCVSRGNIYRAEIANHNHAALFVRIHADGSTNHATAGTSMLYPAWHKGWTDDVYSRSLQAARIMQPYIVRALGWPNRGLVARGDLTGFNWSNVPVILTEVGFLTNPAEDRSLATFLTVNKAAWALRTGILADLHARGLR